jgi:hypothetical protein
MDEEMARRSGKQPIPHKIAAEICNKFKRPFRGEIITIV